MSVNLTIKVVAPPKEFQVDVDGSATVEELKEQVASQAGFPKENIRFVCAGKIWQDAQTVASYEPKDGAIVHCLNNPPRTAPGSAEQTLSAPNPMTTLMGGAPAPQAMDSADPMQQMMAQSQQMLMQNPEMMQQVMNSPMVQQMMSSPETVSAMMRMNPQLQQLMEQRPEIGRLLEDPEVLQQSMRMMANPSLMREMTRNADRAISQLDAMPGGHNALVRAHEEIADPLYEAFAGGSQSGGSGDVDANYAQATEVNSEALPNPWGPPASQTSAVGGAAGGATAAAATPGPAVAPTAPTPMAANPMAANPFAAMMMQQPAAAGAPAGGANAPAANPMAQMMQTMMQNPEMMQQAMQMAQGMMGGGAAPGMGASPTPGATPTPSATPAQAATPAATPAAAPTPAMQPNPFMNPMFGGMQPGAGAGMQPNPMAAVMQQMMANQMMNPNAGTGYGGVPVAPAPVAETEEQQRIRFASQLTQLTSMGFSNEAACLRALAQHNGRVDAAIDTLLSSGEGNA